MTVIVALVAGLVLALALVAIARAKHPKDALRVYAAGQLVAALIYVVFAVAGGASLRWLALESFGVVYFGAAAWGGLRGRLTLFGVGRVPGFDADDRVCPERGQQRVKAKPEQRSSCLLLSQVRHGIFRP